MTYKERKKWLETQVCSGDYIEITDYVHNNLRSRDEYVLKMGSICKVLSIGWGYLCIEHENTKKWFPVLCPGDVCGYSFKKVEKDNMTNNNKFDIKNVPVNTLRQTGFVWNLTAGPHREIVCAGDTRDPLDLAIGRTISSSYFWVDKKNNHLIMRQAQMTGHYRRTNITSTASWEFWGPLYIIDKNKNILIQHLTYNDELQGEPQKGTRLPSIGTYRMQSAYDLMKKLNTIFGTVYSANSVIDAQALIKTENSYPSSWIDLDQFLRTKGRRIAQKKAEKLDIVMKAFDDSVITDLSVTGNTVAVDQANGVVAIRFFDKKTEFRRCLLSSVGDNHEDYVRSANGWRRKTSYEGWNATRDANLAFGESITGPQWEGKKDLLRYAKDINNRHDIILEIIANIYKNNLLESLYKVSDADTRTKLLRGNGSIKNLFGEIPETGKSLYAKIGINQFQYENSRFSDIRAIKTLLQTNNISYIDNDTWIKIKKAIIKCQTDREDLNKSFEPDYRIKSIIGYLRAEGAFNLSRLCHLIEFGGTRVTSPYNRFYSFGSVSDYIQQYSDYLNMRHKLQIYEEDVTAFPVWIENETDAHYAHDRTMGLLNAVQEKGKAIAFEKHKKKWQKFVMEDDKFIITYPEKTTDLSQEGAYLHHCVGGYVDRVLDGDTNILFLRQKEFPNTPWYTIELTNSNRIQQIHGSHNRWLSANNDGYAAVPFVMKWLKKNKIECSDYILLNTSHNYCGNATLRAKPNIED